MDAIKGRWRAVLRERLDGVETEKEERTKTHSIICTVMVALLFAPLLTLHAAADPLDDGYPDIVFSNNGGNSAIYWGSSSGSFSAKTLLSTPGSEGVSVADVNNDGYTDVVISDMGAWSNGHTDFNINTYVYWGAASNPYATKTSLEAHGAMGNSVADLNNDGHLDIVYSNYSNNESTVINSYIYWGGGADPYSAKTELQTHGATGNTVADLNKDGYLDVVFSSIDIDNGTSPNSYIYWGAASNPYSSRTELATRGAYGVSAADLNNDGSLDLVFSNMWDGSSYNVNSYIYWGGRNRSIHDEDGAENDRSGR